MKRSLKRSTQEYSLALRADRSCTLSLQRLPLLKRLSLPEFKEYQKQVAVNAKKLAATLMERGYRIVSGGTDNHLMLVDLTKQDITGKDAEAALGKANITANKNTIPFETRSPFVTSGIRLGAPAVTSRNMKEPEMVVIGNAIADVLDNIDNDAKIEEVKGQNQGTLRKLPTV